MPSGASLVLLHGGREVARSPGPALSAPVTEPGAYRIEVRIPDAPGQPPIPWIVSNPVYIGPPPPDAPPASGRDTSVADAGQPLGPWHIEKDPSSSAILRESGQTAELEYTLGGGEHASQFVAIGSDLHEQVFDAIRLELRGDHPGRVSVQVRTGDGRRWGQSFYVDPSGSRILARVADLRSIGGAGPVPASAAVTSILLVVDLTNAAPGRAGRLTLSSSDLVK